MSWRNYCDLSGEDITEEDGYEVSVITKSDRKDRDGKPAMPAQVISATELNALKEYVNSRKEMAFESVREIEGK